uniref:Hypothetical conserved protein n=1 Tax=Glossina morsitans morsitans TaxID=37546 RepID=D3TS79_GLOMM
MPSIEKVSVEKHVGDAIGLAYHKGHVFSGGIDGKIKIWDSDLNLIRSVDAHEASVYALTVNSFGKLYSSSCDGSVKFMQPPYDKVEELLRCDDAIEAMYCEGDNLYTGDDKGLVTHWQDDKMLLKYNLVEEVKSLAAEKGWIYTVRDCDVVVSELLPGKSGKYVTRTVLDGKSPLCLLGPVLTDRHKYLAYPDRTGKGLTLVKNLVDEKFTIAWQLPDCHELIVNALCGDEKSLYSGGYDNKVKGWTDLDEKKPKALGEIDLGTCVNCLCCGNDNTVYIGCSDGIIRRAKFL